jgi:DNA repair exonuclease SbcCD ATPase subunit
MKKIIFLVVILLIPVCAGADYTVYLKNGSVISDVRSYTETGEEISVYFQTGAMVIPRSDIFRITGEETPEEIVPEGAEEAKDGQIPREKSETQPLESQQETKERKEPSSDSAPPSEESSDDRKDKMAAVKSELDSVIGEIRTLETDEARLVKEINEKRSKPVYNSYQANQLMQETEPLQQELSSVQQRKEELRQQKTALEDELMSMQ